MKKYYYVIFAFELELCKFGIYSGRDPLKRVFCARHKRHAIKTDPIPQN